MSTDPPKSESSLLATIKEMAEFVFALILMVYGVAGYYLLRDQWRVMQLQTEVMQKQTRVMQQQLTDSERSSAESDKVTERQLRIAESQAASLRALVKKNKQQLTIAESQAASLRRQADSLRSQAESVSREADAMNSQAVSTRTLADSNRTIADAANKSAEASQRVASTSAHQLEVTDRPWVRVAMSIGGPVQFGDRDVSLPAEVVLTNDGRAVANDISIAWNVAFSSPTTPIWPPGADNRAIETCIDPGAARTPGKVLFPAEKVPEGRLTVQPIPREAIYSPLSKSWGRSFGQLGDSVELLVVGCVTYHSCPN